MSATLDDDLIAPLHEEEENYRQTTTDTNVSDHMIAPNLKRQLLTGLVHPTFIKTFLYDTPAGWKAKHPLHPG
jgi:hypothetical protein